MNASEPATSVSPSPLQLVCKIHGETRDTPFAEPAIKDAPPRPREFSPFSRSPSPGKLDAGLGPRAGSLCSNSIPRSNWQSRELNRRRARINWRRVKGLSHWPLSLSGDEQLAKGVPGPPRMSSRKGADVADGLPAERVSPGELLARVALIIRYFTSRYSVSVEWCGCWTAVGGMVITFCGWAGCEY